MSQPVTISQSPASPTVYLPAPLMWPAPTVTDWRRALWVSRTRAAAAAVSSVFLAMAVLWQSPVGVLVSGTVVTLLGLSARSHARRAQSIADAIQAHAAWADVEEELERAGRCPHPGAPYGY